MIVSPRRTLAVATLCLSAARSGAGQAAATTRLDSAFAGFWRAPSAVAREGASHALVASGASFDTLFARLRRGRAYARSVPTGVRDVVHVSRQRIEFPARFVIPASYDPARRYPVRVWLHGGVNTPERTGYSRWNIARYADSTRIVVFPTSWRDAMWWTEPQVENIEDLLDDLRANYNVDEARTSVMGISDGGTGALFYAMHAPTRWASYVPLIGHAAVLVNPAVGADGPVFASNLAGAAIFMVNDGHDPLYPAADVARYVPLYRAAGADLLFKVHPEAGHETSWYPGDAPAIDSFVARHVRDPYPDRLSWTTAGDGRYPRAFWLVIRELGRSTKEPRAPLDRHDKLPSTGERVFPWPLGTGRVDIERRGNTITAQTEYVRRFSLLISPDQFDLSQPIRVVVNGERAFDARVQPDIPTLLGWASRDNDRTMLFAAEIEVRVGGVTTQVK